MLVMNNVLQLLRKICRVTVDSISTEERSGPCKALVTAARTKVVERHSHRWGLW